MAWPKEVTVVEPGDVCRGQWDGPNGTHCAVGWARADGVFALTTERSEWRRAYHVACDYLGLPASEEPLWRNDLCRDSALRARAVNLTWALLGYVVNNPEAKTARAMKRKGGRKRVA